MKMDYLCHKGVCDKCGKSSNCGCLGRSLRHRGRRMDNLDRNYANEERYIAFQNSNGEAETSVDQMPLTTSSGVRKET